MVVEVRERVQARDKASSSKVGRGESAGRSAGPGIFRSGHPKRSGAEGSRWFMYDMQSQGKWACVSTNQRTNERTKEGEVK